MVVGPLATVEVKLFRTAVLACFEVRE